MIIKNEQKLEGLPRRRWYKLSALLFALIMPGFSLLYVGRFKPGLVIVSLSFLLGLVSSIIFYSQPIGHVWHLVILFSLLFVGGLLWLVGLIWTFKAMSRPAVPRVSAGFVWLAIVVLSLPELALFALAPSAPNDPFTGLNRSFTIPSSSMAPSIEKGSWIMSHLADPKSLQRGDMVVLQRNGQYYIKRLIGLPGDTVSLFNHRVTLNQGAPNSLQELEQSDGSTCLAKSCYTLMPLTNSAASQRTGYRDPLLIAPNHYYFLGDNRHDSFDSRFPGFGAIQAQDVLYKASLQYWPLNHFGLF